MGKRSIQSLLAALVVGIAPTVSDAAGLGRLTVLSTLGQPLLAEVELLSVQRDELSSLVARVASPEAFSQANIQFNPALVGVRVTVERRQGGQPYLRLSSPRPMNEPFLDILLELTWNSGRLVREYTALLDPPGYAPQQPVAPAVVTDAKPPVAKPIAAPPAPRAAAPQPKAQPNTYGPVRSGETLRKIAEGVRPEGVSLDQVLVGLYRSNRDAFINNNMNLLRTGRILRVPDAAELTQVTPAEAANEIRVQAADWNAYRQKLAGSVGEAQAPAESRAVTGKVTTRVDDKAAAQEPSKEVLKISKGEAPKPGAVAAGDPKAMQDRLRSLEEEATAREKALKDANDRIAALEKTIKDMQRLIELKAPPVPGKVEPAPAAKPEPEKAVAKPEPAPAEKPPVVAEPPKPEPAPAEKPPVVAEKPVVEPPKAAPPKPVAPPPPPEEAFWEDPTVLVGGVAGLLGLGGLGYWMARRRRSETAEAGPAEAPKKEPSAPAPAPAVGAGAAAAATAAAATAAAAAQTTTMTAPVVDDVDPIQEAEVYINYGRDAQAEEILKEAMGKDPGRLDLKTKLLEIYAARKSRNDFNPLAGEVHAATAGTGTTWLRAAQLGYALDPENPLYAEGMAAGPAEVQPVAGTTSEIDLDFDLDMASGKAGAPTTVTDIPLGMDEAVTKTTVLSPEKMQQLAEEGAADAAARMTQTQPVIPDFDIGAEPPSAPSTDIALEPAVASSGPITDVNLEVPSLATPSLATDSNVIDFEFDTERTTKIDSPLGHEATVVISPENQEKALDLGVEIDLGALDAAPQPAAPAPAAAAVPDISFDFELPDTAPPAAPATISTDVAGITDISHSDETVIAPPPKPAAAPGGATEFALDTITFDLGEPKAEGAVPEVKHDEHWYDVQTKFDLAKAYQEMGDKDGAREILAEVIKEGDDQQKAEAQALFDQLS